MQMGDDGSSFCRKGFRHDEQVKAKNKTDMQHMVARYALNIQPSAFKITEILS